MMNFTRFSFLPMAVIGIVLLSACKEDPEPRTMADKSAETEKMVESENTQNSKIKAKVRKVLGETDLLRKDSEEWKRLHYGQVVVERDRIRTAVESEAVMSVSDATSLWITELSDVTLDVEMFDSLRHEVSVKVNNGGVFFDVQKRNNRTFKFQTGIASAAIRGTVGFVYGNEGQMVVSLKDGLVDVSSRSGASGSVSEKQTLLVGKDGHIKNIKLKSSGTKALSKILAKADIYGEGPKADSLEKALQTFDNDYAARMASFEKKLTFFANPLPDTLFFSSVTLQARVNPGVIVTVLGESYTVPANGEYQRTIKWDPEAYGQKRFLASCSDGVVEVPCYMWTTVYSNPQAPQAMESTEAVPATQPTQTAQPTQATQTKQSTDETVANKKLNVSINLSGGKNERKHLDFPAKEYSTNLKFSLSGITADDLKEVSSITVKRAGKVVTTFSGANLSGLSYEVPVKVGLNTIGKYEIEVALKSGKKVRATKTYEVFCLRNNHMGKARNCVKYDRAEGGGCSETHAEEYEAVKAQLKEE